MCYYTSLVTIGAAAEVVDSSAFVSIDSAVDKKARCKSNCAGHRHSGHLLRLAARADAQWAHMER